MYCERCKQPWHKSHGMKCPVCGIRPKRQVLERRVADKLRFHYGSGVDR